MSWYLAAWKKYAVFTGRARRKEYWFFYLFNMIAAWALMFVDLAMGTTSDSGTGVLYSIYALAALLPALAVGVRRMHDTDHSGWWILVPIVNLVFAITEGTRGPNRFGADPKSEVAFAGGYAGGYATGYPTPTVAAGWYPDPTGRHQFRYWDSVQWTPSVSDNGASSIDPLG